MFKDLKEELKLIKTIGKLRKIKPSKDFKLKLRKKLERIIKQ